MFKSPTLLTALLASIAIFITSNVQAGELTWTESDVKVKQVTFYPKNWKGKQRTWVDIVLENPSEKPHRYRTVVTLGDEPSFGVSTVKPVAPGARATLTLSTTAFGLPNNTSVQVEVLE